MFLLVIGKRDVRVESGVIADGSAAGVLENLSYCNCVIRSHKLIIEALNRLA